MPITCFTLETMCIFLNCYVTGYNFYFDFSNFFERNKLLNDSDAIIFRSIQPSIQRVIRGKSCILLGHKLISADPPPLSLSPKLTVSQVYRSTSGSKLSPPSKPDRTIAKE